MTTCGTAAKCVKRYGTTLNRKSTNLAQPSRRSRWQTFCNPGETTRSERHGATNAARVMSDVLFFSATRTWQNHLQCKWAKCKPLNFIGDEIISLFILVNADINHHGLAPLAHKEKQTTGDANSKCLDNLEPTHMTLDPVVGGHCHPCNTANSWPCDCPSVMFGVVFANVSIGASRLCNRRRERRIMIDDATIANSCRISQLLCCYRRGSTITTGSQSACRRTRNYAQRKRKAQTSDFSTTHLASVTATVEGTNSRT